MSRNRVGTALLLLAALGFWFTAWVHSTGLDSIERLAEKAPEDLRTLSPALWLSFSLDYLVLGFVLLAVLLSKGQPSRPVIAAVGVAPFCAALLQLTSIGFVPPTAILLGLGTVTLAAACVLPRAKGRLPAA